MAVLDPLDRSRTELRLETAFYEVRSWEFKHLKPHT